VRGLMFAARKRAARASLSGHVGCGMGRSDRTDWEAVDVICRSVNGWG
jgi:hypothetical protein